MFQQATFRPMGGTAFLPSVHLAGPYEATFQEHRARAFYGPVSYLGQDTATAQAWYERAKKALDRYRFLKSRLEAIDYKPEREAIKTWLGAPNVPGTPEYRFASVNSDFTQDVAQEGVGAYNVDRRQNRVVELEEYNDTFDQKVKAAVQAYGERAVPMPGAAPAAPAAGPDLTIPIIAAGGAVALALLLS